MAITGNTELSILYWHIDKRINHEMLKNKRADYGEAVVSTLSAQSVFDRGEGFCKRNLFRMIKFTKVFRNEQMSRPKFYPTAVILDSCAKSKIIPYTVSFRFSHSIP